MEAPVELSSVDFPAMEELLRFQGVCDVDGVVAARRRSSVIRPIYPAKKKIMQILDQFLHQMKQTVPPANKATMFLMAPKIRQKNLL